MRTLLTLTLSGSALSLLLLALRYLVLKKMPSTVYYYAWLLVLLRFVLPLPGLVPAVAGTPASASEPASVSYTVPDADRGDGLLTEPAIISPDAREVLPVAEQAAAESFTEQSSAGRSSMIRWNSPMLWLLLWAVGAVAVFAYTVVSYLRFTRSLRRRFREPEPEVRSIYDSLPGRKPALYSCRALKTPLMCGVFHPCILVPDRPCDAEQLTNILRHELMHYRRRDPLFKWFAVLVLSLHWFNPLAWLVRRELSRSCELSCDEMLLRSMNRAQKESYGNTLLNMAASAALPVGVVATTFSTEKKNLKERLEQIMHYKKNRARMLAAMLALVLLVGCGIIAGPASAAASAETTDSVVRVSNIDELLAAIAPNTVIELAAGEYNLSTASDYGEDTHSSCYSWNGVWGEGESNAELVIHNVDGLTLRGAGPGETTITAVPRYANVITFIGCQNLTVSNLTAGHTKEPGFCTGGVLRLESCADVSIDACGLFGCGTVGVQALDCSKLSVTASEIYECSYGAVDCNRCWDVSVSGCEIRSHGTREGQGEAMNLFSVSSGEGFTVYNCRIHDSRAQYLLNSSYTKNVLFLSNDVVGNAFGASVFTFQQYGATIDGCCFEGNDVRGGWVAGNGIYAADLHGNALDEEALFAEMVLRDIPPESVVPMPASLEQATEVPVGGQVSVRTVDEFLSAIGPDRTIILEGELFDLSTASNYGSIGTEYYYWQENPDGPALIIHDVSGLSIQASNTSSGATTLAAIPRYADVLGFRNCDNLFLGGFTAGHTKEPGVCSGGVLNFQNCNQVLIEKMRLYGCGILGIQASGCSSLSILRTEIYECSQGAAQFFQTDGIQFDSCDIHDVPSPALSFTQCGDKTWNGEPFTGLNGMYDVDETGTLVEFEYPREEESEPHYPAEDLVNPFAEEPTHHYQAGTPQAVFAAMVQQAIADDDWEALADRIAFPIQFFTDGTSFVIHDREEYLQMVQDGYFINEIFNETYHFRQRIADADLSVFGSCVFGDTCLDHLVAFTCAGSEVTEDNLYITAFSIKTPLWPGKSLNDVYEYYASDVPPTPQV